MAQEQFMEDFIRNTKSAKETFGNSWYNIGVAGRYYATLWTMYEKELAELYTGILYADTEMKKIELNINHLDVYRKNEIATTVIKLIRKYYWDTIGRYDKRHGLNYRSAYLQFLPHFVRERNVKRSYEHVRNIQKKLDAERKKFHDKFRSTIEAISSQKADESIKNFESEMKQFMNQLNTQRSKFIGLMKDLLEREIPEFVTKINVDLANLPLDDLEKAGLIAVKNIADMYQSWYRERISEMKK